MLLPQLVPPQPLALVKSGVSLLVPQEETLFGHHVCGCCTMEDSKGGWKNDVVLVLVESHKSLAMRGKSKGIGQVKGHYGVGS